METRLKSLCLYPLCCWAPAVFFSFVSTVDCRPRAKPGTNSTFRLLPELSALSTWAPAPCYQSRMRPISCLILKVGGIVSLSFGFAVHGVRIGISFSESTNCFLSLYRSQLLLSGRTTSKSCREPQIYSGDSSKAARAQTATFL